MGGEKARAAAAGTDEVRVMEESDRLEMLRKAIGPFLPVVMSEPFRALAFIFQLFQWTRYFSDMCIIARAIPVPVLYFQ